MSYKSFKYLIPALFLVSFQTQAHHSPAMFDGSRQLELNGTVREFQWTNPHSYIQLLVKQDDGTEQEWSVEMGGNVYLYNLGWRPSTIKPGDVITVTIQPMINGGQGGLLMDAKNSKGEQLGGRP